MVELRTRQTAGIGTHRCFLAAGAESVTAGEGDADMEGFGAGAEGLSLHGEAGADVAEFFGNGPLSALDGLHAIADEFEHPEDKLFGRAL